MKFKYILILFSVLFFGMSQKSIPDNAYEANEHPGWVCKEGYVQKRNSCIKVNMPKGAVLNEDGHTWSCTEGFEKYRDKCRKIKNYRPEEKSPEASPCSENQDSESEDCSK